MSRAARPGAPLGRGAPARPGAPLGRAALARAVWLRCATPVAAALVVVFAAACSAENEQPAAATRGPAPPFAPDAVWNRPVARDAPLDVSSRRLVAALAAQARGPLPATINTTQWSTPVYRVPRDQPRVRVTLDNPATYAQSLREAIADVPVPHDARPASGRDGHMVIWQRSTDTMWEFWRMRRAGDGWHAKSAGRMEHVSRNAGYFSGPSGFPWGATATSLPLMGGLMRPAELRRGRIDHALALAIPRPAAGVWAFPAQRTDGWVRGDDAIPEGARFRLDPDVDVSRLHLSRPVRAMARAAQRYGIIVRDFAGAVAFYGEDPSPVRRNPYPAIFGGRSMQDALRNFPWDRLQLLEMDRRTYRGAGK